MGREKIRKGVCITMMGERKRRLASLIEDLAVSTIHVGFFAVVNTIISGCFPLLRFPFL